MSDVIKFNEPNFEMFYTGKISSIRLGVKNRSVGEVVFLENEGTGKKIEVIIRKVEFMMAIDITLEHARNDGFDSIDGLKCELEECYGNRLELGDIVTVLTFNCIGRTIG